MISDQKYWPFAMNVTYKLCGHDSCSSAPASDHPCRQTHLYSHAPIPWLSCIAGKDGGVPRKVPISDLHYSLFVGVCVSWVGGHRHHSQCAVDPPCLAGRRQLSRHPGCRCSWALPLAGSSLSTPAGFPPQGVTRECAWICSTTHSCLFSITMSWDFFRGVQIRRKFRLAYRRELHIPKILAGFHITVHKNWGFLVKVLTTGRPAVDD